MGFQRLDEVLADLLAPLVSGGLLAIDVILIISGVLLIFSLLEERGSLTHLEGFFIRMTEQVHVHVLLMGFLLVFFLEGIAGFGMPALIVAPLLVLLALAIVLGVAPDLTYDMIQGAVNPLVPGGGA